MKSRPRSLLLPLAALALTVIAVGGCARATRTSTRPVSIDARPTPPQPESAPAPQPAAPAPVTQPTPRPQAPPARPRFEADTLAARAAYTRCSGRRLLPEQESTLDSVRQLLIDARTAALRGDSARAQSRAREALQLTRSLNCP